MATDDRLWEPESGVDFIVEGGAGIQMVPGPRPRARPDWSIKEASKSWPRRRSSASVGRSELSPLVRLSRSPPPLLLRHSPPLPIARSSSLAPSPVAALCTPSSLLFFFLPGFSPLYFGSFGWLWWDLKERRRLLSRRLGISGGFFQGADLV